MSSIKDRLAAANAPAWIPTTKGDLLTGKVVNRSTRTTEYGDYEIVTIDASQDGEATVGGSSTFNVNTKDEDGNVTDVAYAGGPLCFHAIGSVAKNEIDRANPEIGDDAGVLFDGVQIAQSGQGKGRSYKIWRIVVDKSAENVAAAAARPAGTPAQGVVAEVETPAEPFADDLEDF